MNHQLIQLFPDIEFEELKILERYTSDLNEQQLMLFAQIYRNKRQSAQNMLIFCIVGFLGFAGLQRFFIKQIGMGILYFLTFGLCVIGTIVDTINYKQLTLEHNSKMMQETMALIRL